MLPAGETPGWSDKLWVEFELGHANIWNSELKMRNKRTGQEYIYQADFEQTSSFLELGGAINDRTALSLELPYMSRGGGFLDNFIDDFHVLIGSLRFNRPLYPDNQNIFRISTDGEEKLVSLKHGGTQHFKLKLKQWWWKWQSPTKGACDCGFSTGLQVKIPWAQADNGMTSGKVDTTVTAHLGIPIGQASGIWLTSAFSYLPRSDIMKDWPTEKWHKMYELASDWALTKNWIFTFKLRMESPYVDRSSVEIVDDESYTWEEAILNQIASGWNAMVHWRGSQDFGIKYRFDQGDELSLHLIEDWAPGDYEKIDDNFYVNNAPDVAFIFKYYSSF